MDLASEIRRQIEALPLTSEQHEKSMHPVWRENRHRLISMMRLAQASVAAPRRVLDVGVAYGYSAAALRAAFPMADLVGIEHPTRTLIREPAWRDICKILGMRVVGADAYALPLRDGRFGVVCAAEIIEHLDPVGLPQFLGAVHDLLEPRGVLVLSTPNLASLTNRLLIATGRSPFSLPLATVGETFGHIREYAAKELGQLLAVAGFMEIRVTIVPRTRASGHSVSRANTSYLLERTLGAIFPRLNGFLVAQGVRAS